MSHEAAGFLLAELDRRQILNALREGFGAPSRAESVHWLLLAAVAFAALLVLLMLVRRSERRKRPRDYLGAVARRLRLNRGEAWTLRRIARRAGLRHPAALLLSPGSLAHATRLAVQAGAGRTAQRRADAVSRKVFGCPLRLSDG